MVSASLSGVCCSVWPATRARLTALRPNTIDIVHPPVLVELSLAWAEVAVRPWFKSR